MSRGLLVDNGASEVTMETMERETEVATVKMERMRGPEGRPGRGRARQGGSRRGRHSGAGSGEHGRGRGGGGWARAADGGGRREESVPRGWPAWQRGKWEVRNGAEGAGDRSRMSHSRWQGCRRRSLQTQVPEGSTAAAAAAAGAGTSRQPGALCVSTGMNGNKKLQVEAGLGAGEGPCSGRCQQRGSVSTGGAWGAAWQAQGWTGVGTPGAAACRAGGGEGG